MRVFGVALLCCLGVGCGGVADTATAPSAALQRKTALWVDTVIDGDMARDLSAAGVSMLVVRRGRVDLGSGAPVLHLTPPPPMNREIPLASALRLETGTGPTDPDVAMLLWNALGPSLGPAQAEIILDLPESLAGMDGFIRSFRRESGLKVVPVLTQDQLSTRDGLATARAAGECVVPLFGAGDVGMRGLGVSDHDSLGARLRPLVGRGVKVRPAIVIRPATVPRLDTWGEDLNPLCEDQATEIGSSTRLHRSFTFRKAMSWSGRSWSPGDRLEVAWMDAARLDAALQDIDRLLMPEVSGWDVFTYPGAGTGLGIGSEALVGYFQGRGPAPVMAADIRRQGRSLRISFTNRGPFSSALTAHGNWVEVSVPSGALIVRDRGGFDRISIGSLDDGAWRDSRDSSGAAVRFGETYVGPRESIKAGTVVLPSSRSKYQVRWRVVLSDGTSVTGFRD